MSIRWENRLDFTQVRAAASGPGVLEALMSGGRVVMDDAKERVPKAPKKAGDEEAHLADTGKVDPDRGGSNTVGLVFTSPYSHWVHEHLWFRHPYGGTAKFLELAMISKADDAINKMADVIGDNL